jgi:citrate lyase subunit beta/citryl-CoA lyase
MPGGATIVQGVPHPDLVLQGAQAGAALIPVCDHYCGVEARIKKSLQLQVELTQEFGACVFDVTLDCEDGAPAGGEAEHAQMVAALVLSAAPLARVATRVHPVDHPSFDADIERIVGAAGHRLCHVMLPKTESVDDVARAARALDAAGAPMLALHALIESPAALHRSFEIAAHPRVQSLSFGLMDFVSAHGGAIPVEAMSLSGQFSHPLVRRAKLEIASACHAHGKTPSHGVVTEFANSQGLLQAARRAAAEFGYTRMWSIHPSQIRPILAALTPDAAEIELASRVILLAMLAHWAPVSVDGRLHDRASYRYFWQLLLRARRTGRALPSEVAGLMLARPE